jgi:SAM-dependent methyltransferase
MSAAHRPGSPHDHRSALEQYERRAPIYDFELALFEPIRRRAIAALALPRGATVIDAGCGTGLSLALLQAAVGARGRIVGIEQCPQMIERARGCVAAQHWRNVTLLESTVEHAALDDVQADAALFHFTHDIVREPRALANVLQHLRPGARVVACGLQWGGFWSWPVNLFVLGAALHSVSSLDGLDRPWSLLARDLDDLRIETTLGGGVYIASGRLRMR